MTFNAEECDAATLLKIENITMWELSAEEVRHEGGGGRLDPYVGAYR